HNNPKVRSAFYQIVLLVILVACAYAFVVNARSNLAAQGFGSGFGFLGNTAGFGINQTLIAYSETDSYGRVFLVGLLNTLLVAGIGIVLATILGFIIGIARLSPNWLVARLAGGYVELIRNLPLLFQILFWYLAVLLGALPGPRDSIGLGLQPILARLARPTPLLRLPGRGPPRWFGQPDAVAQWWQRLADWVGPPEVYLNNRGLILPRPVFGEGSEFVVAALALAIIATIALGLWARRRRDATGRSFPVGWV